MILRLRVFLATSLALLVTAGMVPTQAFAAVIRTTYIVQTTAAGQDSVLKSLFGMGELPLDQLDFVMDGFTVPLTDFEASVLAANPAVVSIQADQKLTLLETQTPTPSWGLDRLDQQTATPDNTYNYPTDGGKGVRVYVVDTGVMASNPEFDGRILTGFDALGQNKQSVDCHGHGTHVAGTVAGTKYGVAKAATIVPVRVLDCNGVGYTSNILTALDWILANNPVGTPAIMSMSIGGPGQPLFNAGVKKLYDGGILPVIAAGNNNADACKTSPAGTPEALTVGASDANDIRASFSNYGDCVDVFAPGTNIISASATNPAGSATMSGTSMATPHVSGLAALYLAQNPTATPAQIVKAIRDNGIANAVNNAQSQFGNILVNNNFVRGGAPVTPNPNPVLNAPDRVVSASVSNLTANGATVSWVDGASNGGSPIRGHIIRALAPGEIYATAFNALGETLKSFTVYGLNANTNYTFSVYAFNAMGSGLVSPGVTGKTAIGAPTAPTGLSANVGATTASLNWATANNGGSPVTSYTVEIFSAATGKWTVAGTGTSTTFTLTGLSSATTYIARVKATSALGTSNPSKSVSFTTVVGKPDVPTALTVSNVGSSTATVAWNPVASTSPTTPVTYVTSYNIVGSSIVRHEASTIPSISLSSLVPGRQYTFSVHSQVGEVVSAESASIGFTTLATAPMAPVGVTVTGVPGSQILRWSVADNGGSPVTGYVIQASNVLASSTATVEAWTTFAEQTESSILLPAAPVTKYVRYRVIAKNAIGESLPSLSVAITTAPSKPTAPLGLSASAPGANNAFTLSWSAPESDGGAPILGYLLLLSKDGKTWQPMNSLPATTLSQQATRPTKGQTWFYSVAAKNSAGQGLSSEPVSVSTETTLPGAPSGLALSLSGTQELLVRWSAPGDNGGSSLTGYRLERLIDGVWSTVVDLPASTLTYTVDRGLPGSIATFRVSAGNALGFGPTTVGVSVKTPYLQASAPENFAAAYNSTAKRVDLSWAAPSALGGGVISSYVIQVSKDGATAWTTLSSASASAFATSVAAPVKGQTLSYRVLASTQFGFSKASDGVAISVATTAPSQMTGPSLSFTGASDITIVWRAPADSGGSAIAGYTLERLENGVWSVIAELAPSQLSFVTGRALPGVVNAFRISATNGVGVSPVSLVATLMTPFVQASAPASFSANYNLVGKRVDVAFAAPADLGGSTIRSYQIQTSRDGGLTWQQLTSIGATTLSYGVAAPGKGLTIAYRVVAVTGWGLSLPSESVLVSVAATVTSAPRVGTAAFNSDGSVALKWAAPTDNGGSPITAYKLQRLVGTTWTDSVSVVGSVLATDVARDLPGARVYWRVIAVNAIGDSAASSTLSYMIPLVKASAVQNLAVKRTSLATVVQVSFNDAISYGGGPVSAFNVYVSRDGGATWLFAAASRLLSFTMAAPPKGATWLYKVAAQTSFGLGDFTDAVVYTG